MNFWDGLTAIALLLMLLAGAVGWGLAGLYVLSRWMRTQNESQSSVASPAERLYVSLSLGLGLLSWLTLFLGLAGLLIPAAAWSLLVLGCGLVAFRLWKSDGRSDRKTDAGGQKVGTLQRLLAVVLVLLSVGSLLYMLLAHALMPPHEWDEIAYHMALARLYVKARSIHYVPFIVHSNWPMNTEMLFSLALLLGSDLVAHLTTWFMSLWTAGGIYLIGRRFLDRRIGLLAATLFLTVPLVKRLSGTGLIDVSLAFYGTAALFAYFRYRENRSLGWAGLTGLFAGLVAGSKLMGGAYPLILGLLIVLDARIPSLRSVSRKTDRSGADDPGRRALAWRSLLIRLIVFGGLGFLMVGPWYARSYAFTGNPIWPFLYEVLGGRDWDVLGDEYHMESLIRIWTVDLSPSLKGLLDSFYYVFFEPERLGGYPGGLGYVLLSLVALSAVALAFFRRVPRLVYELALIVVVYYAIWFLVVSPQVRFLIPILPALALLAAFTFFFIWDRLPHAALRWVLAGILLFFLVRDFPWVDAAQRNLVGSRLPYLTGQVARDDFLDSRLDVMPAYRYINQELPPDAVVLLLPYESRGYYLDRAYFWGHPISQRVIPFEQYDEPERLAADLKDLGITHILDNPHWLYTGLRHWTHDRALMLALETQCGEEIAAWEDILLYRLSECRN
jgi:hypothetical protein